ncbi:MAG: hypothetical protein ACTHOG_07230, partial [Marmoricola sp.]
MRRSRALVGAVALAALAAGGVRGPALASSTLPANAPGWYGYHGGGTHAGYAPSMPPAGPMHIVATRHLDGAVYASPIVA